jgi:two-component system nitrate/nitrite response regulator NarL
MLTRREKEVLRLLSKGLHNSQIAEALAISPETVNSHADSILAKLGVHSRMEAVLWWRDQEKD